MAPAATSLASKTDFTASVLLDPIPLASRCGNDETPFRLLSTRSISFPRSIVVLFWRARGRAPVGTRWARRRYGTADDRPCRRRRRLAELFACERRALRGFTLLFSSHSLFKGLAIARPLDETAACHFGAATVTPLEVGVSRLSPAR